MPRLGGSLTGGRQAGGVVSPLASSLAGSVTGAQSVAGAISPVPDAGLSVLLVLIDDVGTEYFDFMGVGETYTTDPSFEYAVTPFLSQMADDGIWFSQFYATSLCSPSRARFHTGLRCDQTGIGNNIRGPTGNLDARFTSYGFSIPSSKTFLAEAVRAARPNCSTAYFGKWHVADMWSYDAADPRENYPPDVNLADPFKYGFQEFVGGPLPYGGTYEWWKVSCSNGVAGTPVYLKPAAVSPVYDETLFTAGVISSAATSWLASRTGQFFCVVSYDPPHNPVTIPPYTMLSSTTQTQLSGLGLTAGTIVPFSAADPNFKPAYRAAFECMDTALQRTWDAVPEALKPTTVMIVVSDNGTQLDAVPPGFGHYKSQLFWGGTRVPFLVKGPCVVNPGRRVDQIADIGDIFATVLDLTGAKQTTSTAPESKSLLPVFQDLVDREYIQAHKPYVIEQAYYPIGVTSFSGMTASTRKRTVTDGTFRLVYTADTSEIPGGIGFYDTSTDPLEATNLYPTASADFARLNAALSAVLPS